MDINQEALLKLIQKSQFGSSENMRFDGVDWNEVYDEASFQTVLGIVAPEVPEELSDEKWQQVQYQQMAAYIRYCHAETELKTLLDGKGIPFVVLKGNSAAIHYADPSRRAMGDIDFFVGDNFFEKTKEVLANDGYVFIEGSDRHPRHVGYRKNEAEFELHRRFSHDDIDIEQEICRGFGDIQLGLIDAHEFPMLPKLANGLVLLDHMRNHLKGALGLRQVIDWMMYVYRNLDDEYWENEFSRVAKEKKMDKLAVTATRMCQMYLGLPETITWCKGADEKTCEELMECLLASGNFGRKNGRGNSVETVSTNMKRKGLFRWLQYAGEFNWEAYHRHHWLKPFCWLYQIFRYAKQGVKTGRNRRQIRGDLDRSRERFELLKKLGIE